MEHPSAVTTKDSGEIYEANTVSGCFTFRDGPWHKMTLYRDFRKDVDSWYDFFKPKKIVCGIVIEE